MRVLLDENLPHDLTKVLTGHVAFTVQGLGWAGMKNGALPKRAIGECDVFVTMDGNIEHQQDFANLPFGVVVIGVAWNRMADLQPVILTCFTLSVAYDRVKCAASAHLRRGGGD